MKLSKKTIITGIAFIAVLAVAAFGFYQLGKQAGKKAAGVDNESVIETESSQDEVQNTESEETSAESSATAEDSSVVTAESSEEISEETVEESEEEGIEESSEESEESQPSHREYTQEEIDAMRTQGFGSVLDYLDSTAGLVFRLRDDELGGVCASWNADKELAPASMTKMMTLLVACEMIEEQGLLYEPLCIPSGMKWRVNCMEGSASKYCELEPLTVEDILMGIILPSGCDCCLTIAEYLCGTEDEFVVHMNEKAQELGMTHTHYLNATGIDYYGHYTSCNDMVTLVRALMQNEEAWKVVSATEWTTAPTEDHPDGCFQNNNMIDTLMEGIISNTPQVLGCKTGSTPHGGRNLTSIVQIEDDIFIIVTIGAKEEHYMTGAPHFADQHNIINLLMKSWDAGNILKDVPADYSIE